MAFGPALKWVMGGDVSGFNKAVGSAAKRGGKLKLMLRTIGPALSLGVAIAGLKRLTAEFDATAKTARKLGVGAEFLQEMRFAAERTGVPVNALDMGLQRFTRRLAEAKKGGGELKGVLEEYNIALKNIDGTTRSNVEVLNDLADVIQNTEDPAEQLRIAFKAFDSEGAAMVNTLRDGSEGLSRLRQQARDTGNVVGEKSVKQFEKLNDAMGTVKGAIKGLSGNVIGSFLTFGERVGQGAAMMVNSLQGIPTVLEEVPPASERAVAAMGEVERSVANITRHTETLAAIERQNEDFAVKRMTLQQQLNHLRQKEVEIYRTQVSPAEQGSEEHAAGLLELNRISIRQKEIQAEMDKQSLETGEKEHETAIKRLEAEAERMGIATSALEQDDRALRLAELRHEVAVRTAGTAEYAVEQARALVAAEKAASEAAWETYRAKKAATQIGIGGDNVEELDTAKLEYVLRDTQQELRDIQRNARSIPGGFGTSDKTQVQMMGGAALENFINRIESELMVRRQFTSAQNPNMFFNPFEIERLSRVTGGQSGTGQTNELLRDIRDLQERQLIRTPNY